MTAGGEVVRVPHYEEDPHAGAMQQGINTALLGMLLFIGSELMFFAGLFAAYFNARAAAMQWPPGGMEHFIEPTLIPIVATIILVGSSFTMQWGVWRIRKGDRVGMNRAIAVTLLLGVAFLGMQAYDYWELLDHYGFGINSGIYGTLFYTMTGFHGAHVFGGVVGIAVILLRGMAGQFSARHHIAVEAVSAYWHFVDVVWIALFFTLYFLKQEPEPLFVWRNAVILGVGFIVVGVVYLFLQGSEEWLDRTGATLLILLGAAMTFTFTILLRGSRGL